MAENELKPNLRLIGVRVNIKAPPPIGGEYLLEPRGTRFFTNHEFHLIKTETGIRAGEFDAAWAADDPDVYTALALVALDRAGRPVQAAKKLIGMLTTDDYELEQITEPDVEADMEEAMLPPARPPDAAS